jgi:hypothetical protein
MDMILGLRLMVENLVNQHPQIHYPLDVPYASIVDEPQLN